MTRFFPSRWPWWHNAVRGRVLRISLSFYPFTTRLPCHRLVTTRLLCHRLLLSLSFSFLCKLCDFFFKLRIEAFYSRIEAFYHVSFTLRCFVTVTLSARHGRIVRRWVSLSARRRRSPPWRFALQDVNCKMSAVTSGPTLGLWNGLCRRRHYGRVWNRCWCF